MMRVNLTKFGYNDTNNLTKCGEIMFYIPIPNRQFRCNLSSARETPVNFHRGYPNQRRAISISSKVWGKKRVNRLK